MRIKVGIGVMLLKDNKVLLGRRSPSYKDSFELGGTWTMPGGKMEYGETFEETAKREVFEECGIKIKEAKLISISNDKTDKAHFVTLGFLCESFEGKEEAKEEAIIEWKWFYVNNLPSPMYFPSKNIIDNYKRKTIYEGDSWQ